jgi:hypothetical protein
MGSPGVQEDHRRVARSNRDAVRRLERRWRERPVRGHQRGQDLNLNVRTRPPRERQRRCDSTARRIGRGPSPSERRNGGVLVARLVSCSERRPRKRTGKRVGKGAITSAQRQSPAAEADDRALVLCGGVLTWPRPCRRDVHRRPSCNLRNRARPAPARECR